MSKTKSVEMEIVEDMTETFRKYIRERAEDRVKVEMVNTFHALSRAKTAMVYIHVERDLPPDKVITYSALVTPNEFRHADCMIKFTKEAREYFNEMEYKNRNKHLH